MIQKKSIKVAKKICIIFTLIAAIGLIAIPILNVNASNSSFVFTGSNLSEYDAETHFTVTSNITNDDFLSTIIYDTVTTLAFGKDVTIIDDEIFKHFPNVVKLEVATQNPVYCSINGVLYNKDATQLIHWPAAQQTEHITFPSTLKSIETCKLPSSTKILEIPAACESIILGTSDDNMDLMYRELYPLNTLPQLEEVLVDANNKNFTVVTNALYNTEKTIVYGIPIKSCETKIEIPEGIVHVTEGLFKKHTFLTSIKLPASLDISDEDSMRLITANEMPYLEEYIVDSENEFLKSINGVLYSKDGKTLLRYPTQKKDKAYKVPNTVVEFKWGCFSSKNTYLKSITLGKKVKLLDDTGLNLGGLEKVIVNSENPYFSSKNGVLFNKEKTSLLYYPVCKKDSSYIIPDTVIYLGNDPDSSIQTGEPKTMYGITFANNQYLTSITLGSNVCKLPRYFGINNTNLKTILVSKNNKHYSSKAGILYNKNQTTLLAYPRANNTAKYTLSKTVNKIDTNASITMYYAENLKTLAVAKGNKTFQLKNKEIIVKKTGTVLISKKNCPIKNVGIKIIK